MAPGLPAPQVLQQQLKSEMRPQSIILLYQTNTASETASLRLAVSEKNKMEVFLKTSTPAFAACHLEKHDQGTLRSCCQLNGYRTVHLGRFMAAERYQ